MYADYDFYCNVYLGDVIATEEDFERLKHKAAATLDYYTMGRAKRHEHEYEFAIQMAHCAVADELYKARQVEASPAISSETVGSYSRSFRSAEETTRACNAAIERALHTYLLHTGLLFRGC